MIHGNNPFVKGINFINMYLKQVLKKVMTSAKKTNMLFKTATICQSFERSMFRIVTGIKL